MFRVTALSPHWFSTREVRDRNSRTSIRRVLPVDPLDCPEKKPARCQTTLIVRTEFSPGLGSPMIFKFLSERVWRLIG